MSLNVTVGSASAESYATVAEADTYNSNRPFATQWAGSDAAKEAALRWAAILLDASFVWTGAPVDGTQALCWPRSGMLTRNGYEIGTTTIPRELKNAQCEFARQLMIADRSADNDVLKQRITAITAGPVSLRYSLPQDASDPVMLDAQLRMLGPEFAWIGRIVPDAVSLILVPSWFTREGVQQDFFFEVSR